MPVFDYRCPQCGKRFEELVKRHDEEVRCPACGSVAERNWSGAIYTATGKPAKHCNGNCSCCEGCSH